MSKKLTLNIKDETIQFAHSYAKKTQQSVSTIVEKYFENLREKKEFQDISQDAEALYGILEKESVPDKKEMRKIFHEKSII